MDSDVVLDFIQRCRSFALVLPSDAAFSHYTAARFYAAPVPDDTLLHVSTRASIEPRIRGVVAHRVQDLGHVNRIGELRVTSPARTFVDLAARLDLPGLVAAGDVLAAKCEGEIGDLEEEVRVAGRRRGVRLAREAIEFLDPRAESGMESRLRLLLMLAGLERPSANYDVYDERGNKVARIDLAYPRKKVGLEYEGSHHLHDRKHWVRDIHRQEELARLDWFIVRVTAEAVYGDITPLIMRVKSALSSRRER